MRKTIKFGEIINTLGQARGFFEPAVEWEFNPDGVITVAPLCKTPVTMDTDVEVCYDFYYHMNPAFHKDEVHKAIDEKDWDTFAKWKRDFDWGGCCFDGLVYMPDEACIMVGDEWLGCVNTTYRKEYFNLITTWDYECG